MADSEFGGFFDTVKPVLKSDLAGSTSSDPFMPKFGGGSSLPGLGRSGGLGRGLKKPGKGGLMNVDKASDSYFGQNLKTLDSLGGINGYQASSYSFTAKDTTGQGLNNPELQAALKEMAGSDVFIQDDAGNAVPDATKPKPVPAQSEPAQSEPAQSEPAQSEPAQQTSLQLADGVTYQPNINGRDKHRGRTFAVSGKSVSTGNPYDAGQVVESDNPYDNGQRSNAENEWYDNAVRKLSKNMYGVDIDSLEIDDVNGQHIDNPVLDSWKSSLREFIRLNNEAHRRKLSKKEVEAWQAAGNSAYDMQNALRTYSTMMSTHAIPADADSSEVWNDAANAIVAMDKDKLDKYFPGLYESNLYGAAMKQAQAGDVSQLESISQLLQPVIDSRKAAEEPGDPGTVFFSRDFWRWAYDTAGAALVRGFENVKGFSKDLYYRARINDDDEPMTEAERAENEQLKAARDFNLRETQFADEWADQEMQRANDASEVYKTQELIRRGRDYMADRDRVNSLKGGVSSTLAALWRAPIYTTGSYIAQSADTFVGMAIGGGIGGLASKGTQAVVNGIMGNTMRQLGRAAIAGDSAAAASAVASAVPRIRWATITGETIGSGLGAGYNVGAMNVAGDAQAAASRSVDELISDPEFAKFYASQPDSVLTSGVMPVMATLSGSADSRLPELQSLVAGLTLNPVDASGQPRALTADEKRQILAFYDNPLVQQAIDSGDAQSDLISKYRTHIYNRTWNNNLGRDVAVGAVEGMFSPIAGGIFKGGMGGVSSLLTRHINNKLAKAGLSTAYVLGEGGATEGIEQVVSNIGMNEAQGRDPYENWQRNVGESVVSGAIISGVLATPNAIVAMARHSPKPEKPADGSTPAEDAAPPSGGTPTGGSGFGQFDSSVYTDASNLDSDIYNRAAATASQLRDDLEVRRASDPKAVVQPADSPVFHDADGNEVTVPASALDEDIAAVQNAQTRLKQQRGEAEKNGADKAQLDKMDATIREQQNVLNTLRAARRYYKAPQGQTGAQTQQTQTQTGAQTQTQQAQTGGQTQTGDQTQAEQPKPKFKPGRWKASREVKNGKVTPITPTAEQQAMLDKLNAHDKGKFTWEAVGDHEFVRRGSGKKVHIFNTDYLTFNDDGSYEFSTVKDITDDQRKLWEAYRKHKKLSHNTHVDGYFDENGQLTGIAWGLAGKGAGRGGEASFTQMEQTLRDAGVDWKGSDTAQAQEESAQAQEESAQQESAQPEVQSEAQTQTQEEPAPPEAQTETEETAEETAEDEQTEDEQTEDDSVPAVPSAQQAFDDALAAFDPENEGSVDPLLDATQALIDDIVAQNNGVFDPDVRYATSEADEEDHTDPKAQLREVYAKLDKALLRLEPSGIRLGYVAKATKSWLADARARQMMFHLARTLHTKTKAKSPDYFAFDLLSQFVFNSSDMLDSIDKYRVQMGDEFVDAVKMVAPVWKKSGKFNDVRAFRGAPVRSWRDIAQNVIYTIAPEAKPAPQTQPVAPQTQPEQSALDRLKSNEAFKKLNPELQKYLLDENHKLTQGDWVALASTAGLSANESATLIPLVGDVESAAKAVEGIAATTGFLRFLKKIGYKLDETYETQIKNEDEANAKAKRQAEAEAKKKEEEAKLQSMLMPEDEQTGDWGNYNSKLRRADHVVPVHEGLSVDLTGGAENSVPVQQMTDKPMKRSELRARELNADSNVHATIYTKSGTGKDRLIAVPFEEDAANSKLISENPKRLADWLNMKLPDGAVWAKGYSPLDVLIAFFGQISSGKKPKAGTKYYLKYYKGLTYQSIPIPAGGIGESSTGGSVYANKIKDSGGIDGLPALYAGLIQELISINNHIAADHKGSFNSDVLQSDPVVIEADDTVIVIGVESGIGQPYSGTVLISKDQARKEGMLPESAPADVQQEQAQPAEPTAGSAVQISDEAREQIRYYVKQGKPVPDGVKTAYNLTDDIINTVVNEEGLNGTEHQEGQAGAERDSALNGGEKPGESTSPAGSEDSGSAGRTGEAAESTGDVGPGAQSTGTPESPASPAGEVPAAEQGDGKSSVLSNAAPASQTAGISTGVAPDEGGEREESPSDEADAGESAEPADGSKPSVDSGNGEEQLQQTNEELAKVALAEKALKYYNDHTGLRRSTVRSAIADALDSQGKLLAKLPAGYKDIVLDTLTDAVLNVMDSFHALREFIGETSPLLIQFGKEAKYEPAVNRITIPVATALKMTMPAAQKVFGKFTHDPDSDTFVYAKQTYDKADVLKNLLPAMLHAFMWHECAHALFHGVHYNRYKLSAPLRNAIDSTVDQFIRATGIKLPEGHENWARDEIFATGMEMAVLYMRSGNTPATQAVALLTNRFVKAMPELSRLVCATYEPFNYLPYDSYSLKRAIELMNGPLEMLYNGTDKRLMGLDEDSMRIAWKILFARNPEAVNRYVQLLSFMSGEMLNKHNALTYALNTISGMTNSDVPMAGWLLNGRYAMAILRPTRSATGTALDEAKLTIANALDLRIKDLEQLVPDIDQRINDDIAMAQRLKSETEQYAALATNQSDFNAMCNELESALLSGIDADTGAAAQAKPNSQLERNGAANPTPAQEQRSQLEEDKTQGEREKASETANALADNSKLKEDKTPAQEQAEQNADNLITAAVAAANANANENRAPLNLSLTSPYIQEITDSINAAADKNTSYTQYNQLKFMLNTWRDLIRLYGDWLGQNLLRGDVSRNDLMHILDERLYYASRFGGEHYSDSQVRLMAVWLNRFITDSKLGSAIEQAYTGKDWERDDNIIIENSDGTRKVEERQFLSDFHQETISRVEAAEAAKAAAAKAKAAKAAAEAAKAAADAKARALTPDEISEELEKPAPLSPREQEDWKLETELDDQLNIFNRPNKKDTDDGVEDAEDPVGHTNADIDENSAAVKVAAYLRMATGDENDEAVSQWLGFLFENGWGLKKLLLAKTRNKEKLHMTLADFRQVMLDGGIDADVVEKIIYALDNYTNLFAIIETHHPDFRTAPANKQLGKYLGDYAESDRIQNLSDRNDEIEDYDDIKENIISDISSIIDNVYTIDTSITAEEKSQDENVAPHTFSYYDAVIADAERMSHPAPEDMAAPSPIPVRTLSSDERTRLSAQTKLDLALDSKDPNAAPLSVGVALQRATDNDKVLAVWSAFLQNFGHLLETRLLAGDVNAADLWNLLDYLATDYLEDNDLFESAQFKNDAEYEQAANNERMRIKRIVFNAFVQSDTGTAIRLHYKGKDFYKDESTGNLLFDHVPDTSANDLISSGVIDSELSNNVYGLYDAVGMKTEDEADSGTRYATSEADEEPMTEDEAQQTVDESTSSEPDPEIPEDKSEAVDELLDDDSGQTQQTGAQSAQDDEDSSEPAESETGTTSDPDAPETFGELDMKFSDVLDQLFTPDEQKQMAPDLAKVVAKLDRVVKTYGVYRRAFMEQMRNAFDANRIFRENKYVRNYMNHFIDNWDRSVASLETWTIENYQGKVAPEDNPVLQSILLARRIGSSFTEAVNDILQRGMTMNENGARVRMLDANGQPVESVLDATTRMYNKLRDLGLRRDVLDTKENFRKDIGMFRTLLHTIERNEFKHEELKQQYAQLTADYNKAAQDGTPESREAAGELLKKRDELKADILHFEKMMKAESFDDVELGSKYTMPMGGRTNAMARKELDELYKKYDSALKDAGVKDAAERQQVLHEMIVSFNVAYQHAIEELDLLSARSGFFSEHTILQRHGFKYYTPLRQDIGDGRGSTIKAAEGSTIPAVDAITNYAMEAIRRTGAVTRNVIGMALNDAYQNLHDDYEATRADANATPEEKMRNISHQSIGEAKSFNGLLRLTGEDMSRIELNKKNGKWTSKDEDRFNRFKKQAIFVELVRPTTAEERAAGLMDDTQLERMWIGFDPDIIGRARKSAPSNKSVSQQTTDLHGIQNGYDDPEKPGYILYPEVLPRDYSDAGKALVDIAYEPSAKMGNFLKTCGFLTRAASEAMTTFNPLFALKSAIADFRERVTRLGHKEFADSNGNKVSGVRVALRMWRNMLNPKFLGTVGKYSIELAAHKETKNDTQYRKYLSEMHRLGIIGGVQQQMVATGGSRRALFGMNATERINREIERANAEREAQIAEDAKTFVSKLFKLFGQFAHGIARTRIGKFLHAVHNGAIGWSNMFYNVPLAAQYIAMRECGLSERAAAADTAKAMDFTSRGYYHKVGGKFISFLTSITHGTANMLDSYGLNRNLISSNKYAKKETGYVRRMIVQSYAFKAARLSAYLGLIQVLMYAVGACLRPDEPDKRKAGQQLIDNMPLSSMTFLPAPILQWLGVSDPDGFVIKLTAGFGEDRQALNLAWGLDRYSRHKATMSEVAGSYIVNFTSNATPFNMPAFSPLKNPARFAAYTAGHAIPLVSWCTDAALNITYTGRTLDGEFGPAMGQRAYEERNAYVDIAYKDLSKTLYDTLGMNISPSVLKSMYEGIGYGPVVQGIMQFVLHINDEVPRSELDPNWTSANLNVIQKFMGAASLGNKMPEKAYVFNKTMRDYYEGQFVAAGVSALLKAEGSGTKSAAIQQTMRMMGYTPAEIADRVNLNELDNKLEGILKQENNLIELRRFNGISVDQFKKRMNVLSRTANKLETDFMKSSYYYRGVYGKRAGIPDKYRARLERENRLRAIERANKELDK